MVLDPIKHPKPDLAPPAVSSRKKVSVLISGRGSNLASLIAATMEGNYPAVINKVISNKSDAAGLEVAKSNGIETSVYERKNFDSSEDQEAAIVKDLLSDEPDFVCLAGYMRILSDTFVQQFSGRILNIHPSLLPSFRGLDTHHRAIANGVRIHGCTVHVVTPALDEGPILAQAAVEVLPTDTDESLAERVLEAEHRLYPIVLGHVASGDIRISGQKVLYNGDAAKQVAGAALSSL